MEEIRKIWSARKRVKYTKLSLDEQNFITYLQDVSRDSKANAIHFLQRVEENYTNDTLSSIVLKILSPVKFDTQPLIEKWMKHPRVTSVDITYEDAFLVFTVYTNGYVSPKVPNTLQNYDYKPPKFNPNKVSQVTQNKLKHICGEMLRILPVRNRTGKKSIIQIDASNMPCFTISSLLHQRKQISGNMLKQLSDLYIGQISIVLEHTQKGIVVRLTITLRESSLPKDLQKDIVDRRK